MAYGPMLGAGDTDIAPASLVAPSTFRVAAVSLPLAAMRSKRVPAGAGITPESGHH
jgi:hypothetical protein